MCECKHEGLRIHIYTHTYMYIYGGLRITLADNIREEKMRKEESGTEEGLR